MKKQIIIGLGLFVLLAGCANGKMKEVASSSTEGNNQSNSSITQTTSPHTSNSTLSTTRNSSEAWSSKETSTSGGDKEYSYEVSLDRIKAVDVFTRNGMNIPQMIELSFKEAPQGIAAFIIKGSERDSVTSYELSYQLIATKTIRVFSAETNEIRTVHVNTELVMGELLSGDQGRDMSGNLYVFVNKSGSLSLATPNYAGNVEEKDADVMLEYLPR